MDFTELTTEESLLLTQRNLPKGEFIVDFLDKVTKLSKKEIMELPLGFALGYMLQYLYWQNGDIEIAEGVTVLQMFNDNEIELSGIGEREKIIKIDGYSFTNKLTVQNLLSAESRCALDNKLDLLGLYIMASSCLKGIDYGIKAILKTGDNIEKRKKLLELEKSYSDISEVDIHLIADTKHLIVGNVKWTNNFFLFAPQERI
jgi:hypothetical protein